MRWFTVTPLYRLTLDENREVEFAEGLKVSTIPAWIHEDSFLEHLGSADRDSLTATKYGFVVQYEAAALGDLDPNWKGSNSRSIQDAKYELCVFANLAIWLSRPSPVCFVHVIHAPVSAEKPAIQQITTHSTLHCHPNDVNSSVTLNDLVLAGTLHKVLVALPRDTALWTAVRSAWLALQSYVEEIRYSLFWIALEALFGPEDGTEITFRISQRIALFVAGDAKEARDLFVAAKKSYSFRSKVIHGRWKENADSDTLMAHTEAFLRRSLVQILKDTQLTNVFSEKKRDEYLNELPFTFGT